MDRILIVEDGLIVAMHLKIMLANNGYEIAGHLTFGEDVFDTFKKLNPDLLILDNMLEGEMTGIEAAKIIRTISEVPIIFISALTDDKTLDEIAKISNARKQKKPFVEELLLTDIREMLSTK
jgi:DNA-binding response OmpR family regulator